MYVARVIDAQLHDDTAFLGCFLIALLLLLLLCGGPTLEELELVFLFFDFFAEGASLFSIYRALGRRHGDGLERQPEQQRVRGLDRRR